MLDQQHADGLQTDALQADTDAVFLRLHPADMVAQILVALCLRHAAAHI